MGAQEWGCSFVILPGTVRVVERDPAGQIVSERMTHNTITSGGLSFIRDFLLGPTLAEAPNPPSYIGVGSGCANGVLTVGRFDTRVPGETFRAAIVQRDAGDNQSVIFHAFLSTTENLDQSVGCYGLWAGAAGASLNSGTLIAIAQEANPYNKNGGNTYSLDWTVAVSGKVT